MRHLLLTASILTLAACGGKTAAPAATQAPAPSPTPAPATSPTPSANTAPTAAAPTPVAQPAPAVAPSAAPSSTPVAETPSPAQSVKPADAKPPSQHPFENDLRDLEIAVRLIDGFLVEKDTARFEFKVTMADGSNPIDEVFVLEETHNVQSPFLASEARDGYFVKTYRVKDQDRMRMHGASEKLEELKKNSTGGNDLHFLASVQTLPDPNKDLPDTFSLTVYGRSHKSFDFVPLGAEQKVSKDNPKATHLFARVDPEPNGQA